MFRRRSRLSLAVLAVGLSACNVTIDTDEYPYPLTINDLDFGNPDAASNNANSENSTNAVNNTNATNGTNGGDAGPDVGPTGSPELVITEVLINTSTMEVGIAGELGEYIEIKNIGDGPADPRKVLFTIENLESTMQSSISVPLPSNPDQVKVYGELQAIQPGAYFVFVRFATDTVPLDGLIEDGHYFDWGSYGLDVSLSNSGSRLLELQYFDGEELKEFDQIRWSNNKLVDSVGSPEPSIELFEDIALSVVPGSETPDGNDSPDYWCIEVDPMVPDDPSTAYGSPGAPGNCP